MNRPPDILQKIIAAKRREVAAAKDTAKVATKATVGARSKMAGKATDKAPHNTAAMPGESGDHRAQDIPRGFAAQLHRVLADGRPAVIAELKKASPSRGVLRAEYEPCALAKSYEAGGAACLSVLTDAEFFHGQPAHLREARVACALPVLRKDFIIDPWQVEESRALGADCVLLIAAALSDEMLHALRLQTIAAGMDALVEVHSRGELDRALAAGAYLIGINNRNLHTFETRLETTLDLVEHVPSRCTVITESGIRTTEDVRLMREHGVHSFLVGETLMRAADPGAKLRELFGC